ncbi:MAG: type II toxin-antitoxin system VapC family toxin [Archaeoglobales archaeon]|nr:type II toxin-antitoxin system VapC family toxin [Archaeoglobi archaeon]NHW22790.1 type II toxin-antitoxin system VapC family toxin [Archaeoglobales archaeon]
MIIDTSVLLRILRDRGFFDKIKTKISDYKVTSITAYELLRAASYLELKGSSRELEILEDLLRDTDIIPFTRDDLKFSARIWAKLRERGIEVSDAVIMISAICLRSKEKLITLERDFKYIKEIFKELDVEILE